MYYKKLSNNKPTAIVKLSKDFTFFRLSKIVFPILEKEIDFRIKYELWNVRNGRSISNTLIPEGANLTTGPWGYIYSYNAVLIEFISNEYDSITFTLESELPFDNEIEIVFETQEIFKMEDAYRNFQEHINDIKTTRILFSSPFGHGKTTFIKDFFEEYKDDFELFHLYPVNYSVASNADIFEYIKCELLYQLLERDVVFDKVGFSFYETAPLFALNNAQEILAPFLMLLPKVGKSVYNIYEKLYALGKEYLKFDDNFQINDQESALKFLKTFTTNTGSIYEDNFYTQLIRQLVSQLHAKGKQTVLVIDDIDRMDPEHIFRILNVFSAHFDNTAYGNEGISNKFGFDKIILVCDYDNLHKIFAHKYGPQTDFAGYIDKFFSKSIFQFRSTDIVEPILNIVLKGQRPHQYTTIFATIIRDLIRTNNFSVRELIKLKHESPKFYGISKLNLKYSKIPFFNIFNYLTLVISIDVLIEKLSVCAEKMNDNIVEGLDINYTYATQEALIPLGFNVKRKENVHTYEHNGIVYSFSIQMSSSDLLEINREKDFKADKLDEINFSVKDFYTILTKVAKKYKEIEWLALQER